MEFDLQSFAAMLRVSDGAWGTQLQARGLPAGSAPDLWNVDYPGSVEEVAQGYVEAGSDAIITNTFGANRFVLDAHGAGGRVAELVEAGVGISRQAAGDDVKVFASIGPTGKIVMMGDVPPEQISAAFAEAAEPMEWAGADAILLESFAELEELVLALKAVRGVTSLPIVASMTFSSGPDGTATMMGNHPADLAKAAKLHGAAAVGANCGAGPERFVRVAHLLREATDLPLWIKPNAGLPVVVKGETIFPMGAEEFASYVPKLAEAGARFIGGCCGTTPEHIRAVRGAVDGLL